MDTINREIASALIISQDNKIFLGKKKKRGVYFDCWHIPGGGIEAGETKEEALIREIKEETGIDIASETTGLVDDKGMGESIAQNEDKKIKMKFYVYRVDLKNSADSVSVVLGDDLDEYIWLDLGSLFSVKHTPPSLKLFERLGWSNNK